MARNISEAVKRNYPLEDLSLSASGLAFGCFANEPQRTRSPIRSYTSQILHTITMGIEQRVDKGGCFKNCMLKSYALLMAAQKYLFEMQNEYVS